MEYYPGGFEAPTTSPEVSERDDEDEEKDKKSSPEKVLPDRKERAKEEVAKTIEKAPVFEKRVEHKAKEDEPKAETHLSHPEVTDELEAPTNELSESEQVEIVQEFAEDYLPDVLEELEQAEPGSLEEAQATAVAADLENLIETGDLDQPVAGAEVPDAELGDEAGGGDAADAEFIAMQEPGEGEISLSVGDEENSEPTGAGPAAASSGSGNNPPGGARPGGSGTPPPRGPFGPSGGTAAPGPVPVPRNPHIGSSPNTLPASPDVISEAEAAYRERRAAGRGLLVGGIIGYLIGRRGGRIKTEKRLIPVQKKLEKQVENLQWKLVERETKIREIVAERFPERPKASAVETIPLPRGIPMPERIRAAKNESRLGLAKPARAERLGQAIVGVETGRRVTERLKPAVLTPEKVEALEHRDLLEVGEKIVIEGTTLRQIYESNLIGERSLRFLISEHLRGKDIRRELHREMVEREIDFERDPAMRDQPQQSSSSINNSSASLQTLLEKVGATPTGEDELLVIGKHQAASDGGLKSRSKRKQQIADTALVATITILIAFITILLLNR